MFLGQSLRTTEETVLPSKWPALLFRTVPLLAIVALLSCSDGPSTQREIQSKSDMSENDRQSNRQLPDYLRWPAADDDAHYNASPEIFDDEEIKGAAFEHIGRFLKSVDYPLVNVFGRTIFDEEIFAWRGEVSGCFSPIDRTLETPVMEPEMFTVEYVHHVQETLLRDYPLWRLHAVGTRIDGESSLMIYPDAVRVGETLCPPADLSSELNRWRNETLAIRESSRGPQLRQFMYVKERLPGVVEKLKEQPVAYVAAFDNCCGDRDLHSAWFLQRDHYEFMPTIPEGVGQGDFFGVDAEGRVPVPFGPTRLYCLCQWTFPPAETHEIIFREFVWKDNQVELKKDSKAEWRFQIRRAEILKDEELSR